ncbi:MAG: tRNA 2-thiouridine(34) synthase MnmA [Prevotella sp.]|nr:tRNA 2-thiouridine(34) synthase MnmA [Prevotella sp.]
MNLQDKRIAVLLSGGVDSSVVLYELVRQGLHPDCFYIKIGPEDLPSQSGEPMEWDCSSEEDLEMATAVARKYGCRLEVVDCHRDYWDQVTAYTINKVRAGMTPNPDVMCNRLIKFGAFHEKRGHDYDLIATGHYATTEEEDTGETVNGKSSDRPLKWLCTSPDPVKDQTDFLAQIHDWQLRKALFPIGHMMKDEVRAIAEREHLAPAHRRDSQGICFLGKINYNEYLRRYLGELPGDVVELETGRIVGRHRGHWFHTIGQRKGMGLGGGPWFVVKKDIGQNIVYVSHGYDPQTAYRQDFLVRDFHALTLPLEQLSVLGEAPRDAAPAGAPSAVTIKIRHTPEFLPAAMMPAGDGCYRIHAAAPIHGVAPGQFCVVYDDRHHRCFGSGEITL